MGFSPNAVHELQFGQLQNGTIAINGRPFISNQTYAAPPNTPQATMVVTRMTPGQSTTIPRTVADLCGAWPTFVGGGPGAGF